MANYFIDNNGGISTNKRNKGKNYIIDSDGKISLMSDSYNNNEKSAKENLIQKRNTYQKAIDESIQNNNEQLKKELNARGYNSLNPLASFKPDERLSADSLKKDRKNLDVQKDTASIFKAVRENTKDTSQQVNQALNDLKLAQYQYNQEKVNNEKTTFWDKTGGNVTRALADMGSMFTAGSNIYTDENGNEIHLPTYNQLKQDKVRKDYDTGIGRFLGDVTYNSSKILASTGMNALVPGSGTVLYWSDMFLDNVENVKSQGYDSGKALIYSTISTGMEYLTGKFLGSATKGLTGGTSSGLEEALNKGFNKLIGNKTVANILANAGSEGTEEFIQEYLENLNKLIVLEGKNPLSATGQVFTDTDILSDALYSAAVGAASGGALSFVNGNSQNKNVFTIFREKLKKTKSNTTDQAKIDVINEMIQEIDNGEKITVQDLVEEEQIDSNNKNVNLPIREDIESKNSNISNLQSNQNSNDVLSKNNDITNLPLRLDIQIDNALNNSQSNNKSYLGKVTSTVATKIKSLIGIDVSKRTHVLSDNDIRHMLKQHGNEISERAKGQIAITKQDIKNIPDIISNPSNIIKGTNNKNGQTVRYIKRYNDNVTYVVEVVPDKSNTLQIKTMWKKPSTLANDITNPSSTSETQHSDISSTSVDNDTITDSKSQIAPLSSQYNMQQKGKNNTKMPTYKDIKATKIMNPNEISQISKSDADTTPILPTINRNMVGDGDSKFASNIENKVNMLNEKQKQAILDSDEVKYYDKVTNKESLDKAFEKINNGGLAETLSWQNRFTPDENGKMKQNPTATDVAEGWILMKQYSDNGDYDSMVEIAKTMRRIGSIAGQTVQAFNIMERMTPEGMVKYAQSELQEAWEKMRVNKTQEWVDKYKKDFDLTPDEVQFIMDNMKEVSKLEDGYDKRVKLAEIQKLMTDKLPSEKGKAIKSWMRISMLFNPKTQVRNVVGNAIIMPVNSFGDLFSSYADKIIAKKTGIRTTGRTNIKAILKGMKEGAYQATNDYRKGINTKDMQGNRFEIGEGKSFNEKTVIGKSLNRIDGLLNYVMDAGDRIFSQAAFENSLRNQMVLNNTTEVTQDMIDIARAESLQRTWNDNNNYTRFVLNARRGINKLLGTKSYGLGDVLIPFAKTPANLTKAIVDYSPLGLVQTINDGIKLNRSLSNGQYTAQMQHKFVQDLGKATAGSMLYVLGYALAKAGIASGKSDDDKDVANFLKNTLGISSYSIKIGNKSFTYDWAQPIAAPLSIMTNIVNSKNNKGQALQEAILSSLDSAGSILLEQSFLQSLNDVLNDNDGVVSGMINEMLELPSRAIPTFSKQIADMVDGTQRTTFEYGKPLESAINSVKAKIPFVSKTLAPTKDTLGRDIKKYGGKNNIFNVFLNPANVNTENISKSAKEIYRLYKKTGDATIMPRVAPYYVNQDGEKITLSSKERSEYQKISGEIIESSVSDLLDSDKYKQLSDIDKSSIINDIVNYSYNKAREDILNVPMSNQYNKINMYTDDGGSVSNYYLNKEEIDYSYNYPEKYALMTRITTYDKYNDYAKELEEIRDKSSDKKTATIKYINSLPLSIVKKAMFIKSYYSSFTNYDEQIINYINSQKLSVQDKEVILKKLGFTIKNGRVYS